jgi:hypothetical protein
MDQYEVRKDPGWHHHLLTTRLVYFFRWHVQLRLGENSTSHYRVPAEDAAAGGLAPQNGDDCGHSPTGSQETTAYPPRLSGAPKQAKATDTWLCRVVGLFRPSNLSGSTLGEFSLGSLPVAAREYKPPCPITAYFWCPDYGSWPNGIKLASKLLLYQLLTQCLPRFDHQREALGPPLLDARLHAMRSDRVDDQRS